MISDNIINSLMLGVGLAMDAFSVSIADGLSMPDMKKREMFKIAGAFALFQFSMPLIGWFFVHFLEEKFTVFSLAVPYIALILLLFIGIKMIADAVKEMKNKEPENEEGLLIKEDEGQKQESSDSRNNRIKLSVLLIQAVATSIDALSVGFTIAEYKVVTAFFSSGIIGVVTLIICLTGLLLGKKTGMKFAMKAGILGGIILIVIGFKIFIQGVFFS